MPVFPLLCERTHVHSANQKQPGTQRNAPNADYGSARALVRKVIMLHILAVRKLGSVGFCVISFLHEPCISLWASLCNVLELSGIDVMGLVHIVGKLLFAVCCRFLERRCQASFWIAHFRWSSHIRSSPCVLQGKPANLSQTCRARPHFRKG